MCYETGVICKEVTIMFSTSIDKQLKELDNINAIKDKTIARLKEENKELKNKAYKDTELQRMQKKLDIILDGWYSGFPISKKESEAIDVWKCKHEEEAHGAKTDEQCLRLQGCSGGRYSYTFTPTAIGTSGVVRCSCGAEFEFQEIG